MLNILHPFVDVNHAGVTADGAILDVLLIRSLSQVDGHDDFLAASVTDVTGFILHGGSALKTPRSTRA